MIKLLPGWSKISNDFCRFSRPRHSPLMDLLLSLPFFQLYLSWKGSCIPLNPSVGTIADGSKDMQFEGYLYYQCIETQIYVVFWFLWWWYITVLHTGIFYEIIVSIKYWDSFTNKYDIRNKNNKDILNISSSRKINQLQFRELH